MTGAPYLPGFGRCGIPQLSTGHSLLQQVLMLMVICTLHTLEPRFVESHICQNRADVGHPSFVTEQALRNAGLIVLRSVHPEARPVGSVIPVDAVAVGAHRSPNRVSIPVRRQGALSVDLPACVATRLVAQ